MSRRRYISTDISRDAALNRLAVEAGDFVVLLYTWMIPHAGDDGVIRGTAEEIMYEVMPARRDKEAADIEAALCLLHDRGLIDWDPEARTVSFPAESFYKVQTYITDERKRRATNQPETPPDPEPPQGSARNSADERTSPQNTASFTSSSSFSPSVRSSSTVSFSGDGELARAAPGHSPPTADELDSMTQSIVDLFDVDHDQKARRSIALTVAQGADLEPVMQAVACMEHHGDAWSSMTPRQRAAAFAKWMARERRFADRDREQWQRERQQQDAAATEPPPDPVPPPASDVPIWAATLAQLEVTMDRRSIAEWFGRVTATVDKQRLTLHCPDGFHRDWIATRLARQVEEALARSGGEGMAVEYVVGVDAPARMAS